MEAEGKAMAEIGEGPYTASEYGHQGAWHIMAKGSRYYIASTSGPKAGAEAQLIAALLNRERERHLAHSE